MDRPSDEKIEDQYESSMNVPQYKYPETRNEEVRKTKLLLDKRLIWELNELRDSFDTYRYWSRILSFTMVALSVALLLVGGMQLYVAIWG